MHRAASCLLKTLARQGVARLLAVLCLIAAVAPPVFAQTPEDQAGSGASYVTPFPPGDVYKLQVYGDGFAEGLLQGLSELPRSEDRIDIPKKHRVISPLIRIEHEEELKAEEQSRDVVHIGIVMLGLNDRGSLRIAGSNAIKFGTQAWKDQYGQRVDRLLKALKRRNVAVYFVGMPPLRRKDANDDAETVNEVLLEKALANGVRFVETVESFSDENGAFSQFLPDISGNREKLRDADGVSFTSAGNRKLASLVANEMKRDLAAARAERAVPLAGGDAEQKRINPEKAAAAASNSAWKGVVTKDGKDARPTQAGPPGSAQAANAAAIRASTGQPDQKAENGRLMLRVAGANGREENAMIEIVRPAISAAVIALLTRKETVEAVQQPFEMLADDVGDGISVSTMVVALGDSAGGRRRGAGNLAGYTAVWVRGERLPPKPGRADDFAWPRPEALPLPAAASGAAVSPSPAAPAAANTGRTPNIPAAQPQIPRVKGLPPAQPGNKG